MITYSQTDWGDGSTAAGQQLVAHYDAVYPAGAFEVGLPGAAGFSLRFSGPFEVLDYLPGTGTPGPLTMDISNPTTSQAGALGGEVAGLKLNVDFSHTGYTIGTSGVELGNLTLCGFTGTEAAVNGADINELLGLANTALGGGPTPLGYSELSGLIAQLNVAFGGGSVGQFARDHVAVGSCP